MRKTYAGLGLLFLLFAVGAVYFGRTPKGFDNPEAFFHGPLAREFLTDLPVGGSADARAAALHLAQDASVRLRQTSLDFLEPLPPWGPYARGVADDAVKGVFTLQGVSATVPRFPNGHLDWNWRGPNNDPEFAWFLNRLEPVPFLLVAWRETGEKQYRAALNDYLRDWVLQNPRPLFLRFSASWRALEAARRIINIWLPLLLSPAAANALDDDTAALLIASLPEHAAALRAQHSFAGNHLITEMTALAAIALAFPEFRESPGWLDYSLRQVRSELQRQFYPDGAQTELANLYQRVVLLELQRLADMLSAFDRKTELAELRPAIERGWDYYARTLAPIGHGPLNNDSSLEDDAALVKKMAGIYGRADWLHIAAHGAEGAVPAGPATAYFPYAGMAVMRGGWKADQPWAYFDLGPYGTDHQHDDRLQLSLGAGGREFLVDDGRYIYQPGEWRDYFTGPRGHNVVLLDGAGTIRPPRRAASPPNVRQEIGEDHAFFSATAAFAGNFSRGQGPAYHTRVVFFSREGYWIVADRVLAAGPHEVEILWHFHPDCSVLREGPLLFTKEPRSTNFGLLAVNVPDSWPGTLIRGLENPPQGWYSPSFNKRLPATCAKFSGAVEAPRTFVWLIWSVPPGRDVPASRPKVEIAADTAQRLEVRLAWPDGRADAVTLPLATAEKFAWQHSSATPSVAANR